MLAIPTATRTLEMLISKLMSSPGNLRALKFETLTISMKTWWCNFSRLETHCKLLEFFVDEIMCEFTQNPPKTLVKDGLFGTDLIVSDLET